MLSGLWAAGEREEVARRLTFATRATLQVTLPLAGGIALFAPDIVDLWLGADAPGVTATIVVLLMAVQALTLTPFPAEKALIAVGRVRPIGILALVEGLSNIALSIALTVRYGALGPALGTLLTNGFFAPIRFPLVCRALGWPLSRFLRESVGAATLSSLPALVVLVALWLILPDGALRALLGPAAGALLAFAVAGGQIRGWRGRRLVPPLTDAGIEPSVPSEATRP
jgi:O-antigen/teichoic acid export membrane protein